MKNCMEQRYGFSRVHNNRHRGMENRGEKSRKQLIKSEQEALYFFFFFTLTPISSCNRRITDRGEGRRLQKFIYNVQLNRVRTIQLGEHLIARRWPQPRSWDFQSFARPRWLVR